MLLMTLPARSVHTPVLALTFKSPELIVPGAAASAAFQLARVPPPPSSSAAPTAMAAVPLIRVLFFMMSPQTWLVCSGLTGDHFARPTSGSEGVKSQQILKVFESSTVA